MAGIGRYCRLRMLSLGQTDTHCNNEYDQLSSCPAFNGRASINTAQLQRAKSELEGESACPCKRGVIRVLRGLIASNKPVSLNTVNLAPYSEHN